MGVEIRAVAADELGEMSRLTSYVFAKPWLAEGGGGAVMPEWTTCAFVDGRLATCMGAFPFRVRLNNRSTPMAGVTMVASWPEFRRRGLLRQVMTEALGQQRDRGQPLAILWASMAAIYQRFGYGAASTFVQYRADRRSLAFTSGDPAAGSMEIVPLDVARPVMLDLYRAFAQPRNLMIQRAAALWDIRYLAGPESERNRYALYRRDGEVRGYAILQLREGAATQGTATQVLSVLDAAWLDTDAHRGLWEFLASHDLVDHVVYEFAPPDDPIAFTLLEPRELRRTTRDGIWMRVVDVEHALPARPYADAGQLALRVHDPLCDWNDGTWMFETTGEEAAVTKFDSGASVDPDLTLPAASLAVLLSGHTSATNLMRAGQLEAGSDKALALADRLFATAYAPWCPDVF